ncbi:MAG: hypothetical protein U0Q15_15810 [Kineosporiaceae bacterium]
MSRPVTRGLAALLALGVVGGGVAACGEVDARAGARNGLENLRRAQVASFTVSLDDPSGSLSELPGAGVDAARLRGASVRLTVDPPGTQSLGATPSPSSRPTDAAGALKALKEAGSVELAVSTREGDALVLRLVDGVLYARVDQKVLSSLTGTPTDLGSAAKGLPGLEGPATSLEKGRWISADLARLAADPGVSEALKGAGEGQEALPSDVDPALLARLATDLRSALSGKVSSVERIDGDEVRVDLAVKARDAARVLLEVLDRPAYRSLLSSAGEAGRDPAAALKEAREGLDRMPDVTLRASAFVAEDHLRRVRVDLAGLGALTGGASRTAGAALVVDVDDTADAVVAPPAAQVDAADGAVSGAVSGLSALKGLEGLEDLEGLGDGELTPEELRRWAEQQG